MGMEVSLLLLLGGDGGIEVEPGAARNTSMTPAAGPAGRGRQGQRQHDPVGVEGRFDRETPPSCGNNLVRWPGRHRRAALGYQVTYQAYRQVRTFQLRSGARWRAPLGQRGWARVK